VRHYEVRSRRPSQPHLRAAAGSLLVWKPWLREQAWMPLLPIGASMGLPTPERSLCYGKISRYKDSNHKNQPRVCQPKPEPETQNLDIGFRPPGAVRKLLSSCHRRPGSADVWLCEQITVATGIPEPSPCFGSRGCARRKAFWHCRLKTAKGFAVAHRCNTFATRRT
jgi:hypothetical protein